MYNRILKHFNIPYIKTYVHIGMYNHILLHDVQIHFNAQRNVQLHSGFKNVQLHFKHLPKMYNHILYYLFAFVESIEIFDS